MKTLKEEIVDLQKRQKEAEATFRQLKTECQAELTSAVGVKAVSINN